jgi:hypothetical protein
MIGSSLFKQVWPLLRYYTDVKIGLTCIALTAASRRLYNMTQIWRTELAKGCWREQGSSGVFRKRGSEHDTNTNRGSRSWRLSTLLVLPVAGL